MRKKLLPGVFVSLCVGLVFAAAAVPAGAKKKHPAIPWAGSWTGMTEVTQSGSPAPISFRITNAGWVVGLTTTVVTFDRGGGCPAPTPATVNMRPVRMISPAPGKPRKRFEDIADPNGVSPPGTFLINGKVMTSRRIEGHLAFRVEPSPGLFCSTGFVDYTVTRAGRQVQFPAIFVSLNDASGPQPRALAVQVTGRRAAALKKCKKKSPKGPRRKKCIKKAKKLPV